jgi:nitrogen fixation protein FixH
MNTILVRWWVLLLVGLAACTATPTSPAAVREQQIVDGVTFTLERAADPRLNLPAQFIVTLADAQGIPIDTADVYLDLTMPADPMGSNQPIADPLGNGRYRAQSAFIMAGDWSITVVATIDNTEYRAMFDAIVTK